MLGTHRSFRPLFGILLSAAIVIAALWWIGKASPALAELMKPFMGVVVLVAAWGVWRWARPRSYEDRRDGDRRHGDRRRRRWRGGARQAPR